MSDVRILEQGRPLSECWIWPEIERFYGQSGPEAWSQTPYYPTNNAFLAESYATLIAAFLRDSALDLSEPIYLIELAAGLGVLAHFVLAALPEKLNAFAATRNLNVRYVLTDFTERNLEFWSQEPQLRRPEIDVALWQSEKTNELILRRSGVRLAPGKLRNPPLFLANYFFDSIPHDYFWTDQGKLFEVRPVVCHPADTPPALDRVTLHGQAYPTDPATHYPDPRWNAVLAQYVAELPEGSVLFPVGALRSIEHLTQLSGGRGLLLCADKGFHRLSSMAGRQETPYTPHTGSFSFMVNFDALRRFIGLTGGHAWHGPPSPTLEGFAATLGTGPGENLSAALPAALAQISDGYALALRAPALLDGADDPLTVALSSLRRLCADPWVFQAVGDVLLQGVLSGDTEARESVRELLPAVEARLTPTVVGAFSAYGWLRSLLFHLDERERCLALNEKIVALYGPHRDGFFYPAIIAEGEGQLEEALQLFTKASEADPECALCRDAILRLSPLPAAVGFPGANQAPVRRLSRQTSRRGLPFA